MADRRTAPPPPPSAEHLAEGQETKLLFFTMIIAGYGRNFYCRLYSRQGVMVMVAVWLPFSLWGGGGAALGVGGASWCYVIHIPTTHTLKDVVSQSNNTSHCNFCPQQFVTLCPWFSHSLFTLLQELFTFLYYNSHRWKVIGCDVTWILEHFWQCTR
jgi:hypothetical protein